MGVVETDGRSSEPAVRDLRGILVAFLTALAMWGFLLVGVLGLVLKILSGRQF
jgi:hypothetical protein